MTSENVRGKVDVWSEEGVGTEIKVTFPAEVPEGGQKGRTSDTSSLKDEDNVPPLTISMVGFSAAHKGIELLNNTIRTYLITWWGFEIVDVGGDIVPPDTPRQHALPPHHDGGTYGMNERSAIVGLPPTSHSCF